MVGDTPRAAEQQTNLEIKHLLPLAEGVFQEVLDAPRGEPNTYGATPLDRVATLAQQIDVRNELQQLTYRDIPEDVPLEVIDYVHRTFAKRFDSRAEANEENFTTSLSYSFYESIMDPAIISLINAGRKGTASPAELMLVRNVLGMRSTELACLTHPYGKKIPELLNEMRFAVEVAADMYGGEWYDDPKTVFSVKESIGDEPKEPHFESGVLMTRKRTLGTLPDGTIIRERSSFVLRTDPESGFDQSLLNELKIELARDPTIDWRNWLVEHGEVDTYAAMLLDKDEASFSLAIPISTTIYAFNKGIADLVYDAKYAQEQARIEAQKTISPELHGAVHDHRDEHRSSLEAMIARRRETLAAFGMHKVIPLSDVEVDHFLRTLDEHAEDDDEY